MTKPLFPCCLALCSLSILTAIDASLGQTSAQENIGETTHQNFDPYSKKEYDSSALINISKSHGCISYLAQMNGWLPISPAQSSEPSPTLQNLISPDIVTSIQSTIAKGNFHRALIPKHPSRLACKDGPLIGDYKFANYPHSHKYLPHISRRISGPLKCSLEPMNGGGHRHDYGKPHIKQIGNHTYDIFPVCHKGSPDCTGKHDGQIQGCHVAIRRPSGCSSWAEIRNQLHSVEWIQYAY